MALLTLTAWRVLPSLNRVVGATVALRGLQATALPCLDYFEELNAANATGTVAPAPGFRISGDIVFDHVSYRYPGADRDALTDICCTIPLGSTVGLVGRSGAGSVPAADRLCAAKSLPHRGHGGSERGLQRLGQGAG